MKKMEYTPNGVNLADGENDTALQAAQENCPKGYSFTKYVFFVHGETTHRRTWWAMYLSPKGRSKRLPVMEVVPVLHLY